MGGAEALIIRQDNQETRKLAAEIISQGGLIAFRTDTFYGLGADPLNREAVKRIHNLKEREDGKPILLLIADLGDVDLLMRFRPALFTRLTNEFWPGPLTIVLPAASDIPDEITARTGTVGLRLPDHDSLRLLLRECGGRLTATSANPAGVEPAKSAGDVQSYFMEGIDLIIDGGVVTATQPSTVIDIAQERPRLIREGVVPRAELERVLGGQLG